MVEYPECGKKFSKLDGHVKVHNHTVKSFIDKYPRYKCYFFTLPIKREKNTSILRGRYI